MSLYIYIICMYKYIFDTASGVIPAELNLIPTQQSNGILNSTITWKQEDQTITNYLITILPPPPYGPNEIMTSTASAKLSLSDSIQYSITISLIVCAKWINTTFTFGMICVVYCYIEKYHIKHLSKTLNDAIEFLN